MYLTDDGLIIIPEAGKTVPRERVDYYDWRAQAVDQYRIELAPRSDGRERFMLERSTVVRFEHLLYRIGSDAPILLETQDYRLTTKRTTLLDSDLYSSLSERTQSRLQDIMRRVLRTRQRLIHSQTEIDGISQLIGPDNTEGQNQLEMLRADVIRRQQQIDRRMLELAEFAQSKTVPLTEALSIMEFSNTEYWGSSGVKDFYEAMLGESYVVRPLGTEINNAEDKPAGAEPMNEFRTEPAPAV